MLRDAPPGIAGLGSFLIEHWDEIEADFARYYPATPDLGAAVFGDEQVSARRLGVLVRGLPLESRTARAIGAHKPGEPNGYDLLALDLLALIAEVGGVSNFLFLKAHTKRGTRVPDPLKIPRVWRPDGQDKKRPSTPAEISAFFGNRMKVRYTPKEES